MFSYIGLASASLLIVLRVCVPSHHLPEQVVIETLRIAIWNKNKIVVVIAASLWITNVAVMIRGKSSHSSVYCRL